VLSEDFLRDFKRLTEEHWRRTDVDPSIYGFQFQRGTCWNPGLKREQVREYEAALGVRFPQDFRVFLRAMNGTNVPTLNVYGHSGEPHPKSVGVYSYPRDLEDVRRRIEDVEAYRDELSTTTAEQGFNLAHKDFLVPIYIHRYIVCTSDPRSSVVLSIDDGADAIVYGNSLQEYLEREFLKKADAHQE
jgi:hypothetical protein